MTNECSTKELDECRGLVDAVELGQVRYLLCPGHVVSKADRQYHYVGARDLARLYGVRMDQCEVRPERMMARFGWRPQAGLIELHPRYDGDYSLPSVA